MTVQEETTPQPPAEPTLAEPMVWRIGEMCPVCHIGILEYNGMADIECPVCHETQGPGAGCT